MSLRNFKTIKERREFIEKTRNRKFSSIKIYPTGLEVAEHGNCENMIGAVQVPLGIAGPLLIAGQFAKGEYYIPLATTEGALVASVNRGCKAITKGAGARVYSEYKGITRGAIFATGSLEKSFSLKKWISRNFDEIRKHAEQTSSHLKLLKIDSMVVGRNVYVRFSFDTTDAMGMNMATIAADSISKFLEKKAKVTLLSLAGNFDVDKKPAWLNFILGRGRSVWAEAVLSKQIVKDVLKTTPEKFHEVAVKKCLIGSAISGSLGFNAHFANIVTAIFIACGQDVAQAVEGSLGITSTEVVSGSLSISIFMPDLVVGTVGGGTKLPAQKEALSILGLAGGREGENAARLAEIIGGSVLAGEVSLIASLAQGSLASAHTRLGRYK